MKAQGPQPENILFLVHEVFEGLIMESFQGVTYDYSMPCPNCVRMVSNKDLYCLYVLRFIKLRDSANLNSEINQKK